MFIFVTELSTNFYISNLYMGCCCGWWEAY